MKQESQVQNRYIQIYTGDGKGKTSAALGLVLRALGHGLRVKMISFMKGNPESGEMKMASKLENFTLIQSGGPAFVQKGCIEEKDVNLARKGFELARKALNENIDILILDEINVAVDYDLIPVEDLLELMRIKPAGLELVLTGRKAHPEIVKRSDFVSEILLIKHPYEKGVPARPGFDY